MPHTLRIALRALGRHKLRTALTTLGMTIGVAAVITMVALGTGAQETVADDVRSAGTNLIRVDAGNVTRGGDESKIATGLGSASTLTADDAPRDCRDGRRQMRVERGEAPRLGRERRDARVLQVLGTGRLIRSYTAGEPGARAFFRTWRCHRGGIGGRPRHRGARQALRRRESWRDLLIRDATVRVVGVVSGGDDDQMDMVFVPFSTLQRVVGIQHIHSVVVAATQAGDYEARRRGSSRCC
jgi:hypothetical protein